MLLQNKMCHKQMLIWRYISQQYKRHWGFCAFFHLMKAMKIIIFMYVFCFYPVLLKLLLTTLSIVHPWVTGSAVSRAESQLTAGTSSIISTRGRAISQQGHQGAAAEVPLFIYFPQADSVIHKLNEWQWGECQQPGAQWRLCCIYFRAQKPIHYKRVIIVLNRLIHAER